MIQFYFERSGKEFIVYGRAKRILGVFSTRRGAMALIDRLNREQLEKEIRLYETKGVECIS